MNKKKCKKKTDTVKEGHLLVPGGHLMWLWTCLGLMWTGKESHV